MHRWNYQPGDRLGPYTLGTVLGEGGWASVFEAVGPDGQPVAVKVCRAHDNRSRRRFLREFEAMRQLRHAQVVRVHEVGIDRDIVWFSMERVQGVPFHSEILNEPNRSRRIKWSVALGIRLLETLASLHARGFVHRDIKPSNVLVDGTQRLTVLDFGVSSFFSEEGTTSNVILGTIPYMAPEQVAGMPTDEAVDIYAAGLLLHEAVHGVPDAPANAVGWMVRACQDRRPALATVYPEVPHAYSCLVESMLDVEPSRRPTAQQALARLELIASGETQGDLPGPGWVAPQPWWSALEDGILESPAKLRIVEGAEPVLGSLVAEQLQRMALMEGLWWIPLTCQAERVGSPLQQWVMHVSSRVSTTLMDRISEPHAPAMTRFWPHLPLNGPRYNSPQTTLDDVADAATALIRALEHHRPLVLYIDRLEEVDALTAKVLEQLAEQGPRMVLHHDRSRQTPASCALVERLSGQPRAALVELGLPQDPIAAIQNLCPLPCDEPPVAANWTEAIVRGWTHLAQWRGDPEPTASPLGALEDLAGGRIPTAVLRALDLPLNDQGHVSNRATYDGTRHWRGLWGRTWTDPLAPAERARALAETWERFVERGSPEALTRLWLLAGEPERAKPWAAQAALRANHQGRYHACREWWMLHRALPGPTPDDDLDFELSMVKARFDLRILGRAPRFGEQRYLENRAKTPSQRLRILCLGAEFDLQEGQYRRALATTLRLGARHLDRPHVSARALLLAIHARTQLGESATAARELNRARDILSAHPDIELSLQADNWEAELAWFDHDLARCKSICDRNLERCRAHGYGRGASFSLARQAALLRVMGHRDAAERAARAAMSTFEASGDLLNAMRSTLHLATLEAERADLVQARRRVDRVLRRIQTLQMERLLLPSSMRIVLRTACESGELGDAEVALSELTQRPDTDSEAPAAMVRWWSVRGDLDRALAIAAPPVAGFGRALWHIERSRALHLTSDRSGGRTEAQHAHDLAGEGGFVELALYGQLLGATGPHAPDWEALQKRARNSQWQALSLVAMRQDAERMRTRDATQSALLLRALAERAKELGLKSQQDEAVRALTEGP